MSVRVDTDKIKKAIIFILPCLLFFWIGDKVCCAYRTVGISGNISVKAMPFFTNLGNALTNPLPSLHPLDAFVGFMTAVIAKLVLEYKRKHRKKYAEDKEYGSARWGTPKDIEPYMDRQNFDNNVLLTQTERITMGKPSNVKYARNQNVLVVGGSGSGKTRFYVKPNLMQMHSSYVVTDPKGTVLVECGKMLQKGKPVVKNGKIIGYTPYSIRVFNTIDFSKSMHYNPFAYIRPESREQDILRTVEVLITNTTGDQKGGDEFWVKAEKLLYTSYIALIITMCPEEEWNFETLTKASKTLLIGHFTTLNGGLKTLGSKTNNFQRKMKIMPNSKTQRLTIGELLLVGLQSDSIRLINLPQEKLQNQS